LASNRQNDATGPRHISAEATLSKGLTISALVCNIFPPLPDDCITAANWGEPFDFLTWFEYAPEYSEAFEEMVSRLRKTKGWKYVDREIDIRPVRS
jgi:hypothetical protein